MRPSAFLVQKRVLWVRKDQLSGKSTMVIAVSGRYEYEDTREYIVQETNFLGGAHENRSMGVLSLIFFIVCVS